ncbi:apyrase SCDLUD_005183 [Saccharomycodes ludwigii]|uniref:apyrase n=1 Tax=Saccharomycodes ludwigii TaxID=36035 RepID=UPI001E843E7E|nr:hypothetical protein SCDLUD_005183 [Saccharomycodes ludwigii]KAH3898844.1 hypothetical protein SCDLUD_005183 [Saccharomycodes ludwigii]
MSKSKYDYGIVIDAGSSGSRLFVYEWEKIQPYNHENNDENNDNSNDLDRWKSVPKITFNKEWTYKITPGLSSFENSPKNAFKKNIKPLLKYAETIIPSAQLSNTPIFIQATAGMRLLPKGKSDKILNSLCSKIKQYNVFLMEDCDSQIQIIDGEIEGVYGWLSLNYLQGNFNNFDNENKKSFGFMDMGGASTQIAFSPSSVEQIERHRDYISQVRLRNLNGELQTWDIFVSTWLGFGANQARKRFLTQLVNSLPENSNDYDHDDFETRTIVDPCLPKNAKTEFYYKGSKKNKFDVVGSGDYEQCVKSIYPLLLKNLPCKEEPCLFNGVHAPAIDFYKDKFVGVSEYWYTANDIFQLGGEYNFETFSEHVKAFCESDWKEIEKISENGGYNKIPKDFLLDSCFKANWILNILHEGFELPRINVDTKVPDEHQQSEHIPFQSVSDIDGFELTWTLGKILLYSCGLIVSGDHDNNVVGFLPSKNERVNYGRKFIPGVFSSMHQKITSGSSSTNGIGASFFTISLWIFLIIMVLWSFFFYLEKANLIVTNKCLPFSVRNFIGSQYNNLRAHGISGIIHKLRGNNHNTTHDLENNINGNTNDNSDGGFSISRDDMERAETQMRSRSMMNLNDHEGGHTTNNNKIKPHLKAAFSMTDFKNFK